MLSDCSSEHPECDATQPHTGRQKSDTCSAVRVKNVALITAAREPPKWSLLQAHNFDCMTNGKLFNHFVSLLLSFCCQFATENMCQHAVHHNDFTIHKLLQHCQHGRVDQGAHEAQQHRALLGSSPCSAKGL